MRRPFIALGLSIAAAAATAGTVGLSTVGLSAAGADPISCPELPQDRIDGALGTVAPPFPDRSWQVTAMGGSVDCTLNWVRLGTEGGTGSSPVQILLFDHTKFAGTTTKKVQAFTSVIGTHAPGQITVRFRWLNPDDATAFPTGQADVRFQTFPQSAPRAIDAIPPQVAD